MSYGNQNKPFNDVIAHKQKIEGYPTTTGKLPFLVKWVMVVLLGGTFLLSIFRIVSYLINF
ncbi:hypothetical protein [Halobacillus yeomjeoni]|uniref:Uncharacterized protein n=1 Tax=Halobacillus yeomjeoni TaxID=311194 RepID=A0A931MWN6_9BACI|nr:hypothetical protein [Halobacillus yeomjeoni]MBH0231436.1 hypothetical protein [Halobacillus yeomjeoni]